MYVLWHVQIALVCRCGVIRNVGTSYTGYDTQEPCILSLIIWAYHDSLPRLSSVRRLSFPPVSLAAVSYRSELRARNTEVW